MDKMQVDKPTNTMHGMVRVDSAGTTKTATKGYERSRTSNILHRKQNLVSGDNMPINSFRQRANKITKSTRPAKAPKNAMAKRTAVVDHTIQKRKIDVFKRDGRTIIRIYTVTVLVDEDGNEAKAEAESDVLRDIRASISSFSLQEDETLKHGGQEKKLATNHRDEMELDIE